MGRAGGPLDDETDRAITRRAKAVRGEVEDYRARPKRSEFDDLPSDADLERFGGVTVKCPECGAEVFDDVAICHTCGRALADPAGRTGRTWPVVVVALIVLGLVAAAIF